MITLEEKIEHERKMAKRYRQTAESEIIDDVDCLIVSNCLKSAEEHNQYAEWLEELKLYKESEIE